ncbi:MAG: hypothetical protein H6719_27100 [Sandaracinaceae bacterium]|nr:hypothetical protein [Sandaracinaceae bacterium]
MRRAWLALLLAGCAQNAILELTFEVPTADAAGVAGATVAVLEFRSDASTVPPSGVLGTDMPSATLLLPPGGPVTQVVSVVAPGDAVETPLWVGVHYCAREAGCLGADFNPMNQSWVRYERAFYVGEYTEHGLPLPAAMERVDVDACLVYGCLDRERPSSGACDMAGVHACEQ